jgi:hypothetical protein
MIKNTFDLRAQYGKFEQMPVPENCPSFDHAQNCEACGSNKPEKLIAVQSGTFSLMVGSTCAKILCSSKNPKIDESLIGTGETYQDGMKEIVYITLEWITTQENKNTISFYPESHQPKYTKNDMTYSIIKQARDNKKISKKQYDAVNKIYPLE